MAQLGWHSCMLCRVISHPTSMVTEAEDSAGRIWALKRVQADNHSIREAERMVKLCKHPLIAQLQSVFMDGQAMYLQMPFYRHGNLRSWFEQMKVCAQCSACSFVVFGIQLSARTVVQSITAIRPCINLWMTYTCTSTLRPPCLSFLSNCLCQT